jgi:hypothetical protein
MFPLSRDQHGMGYFVQMFILFQGIHSNVLKVNLNVDSSSTLRFKFSDKWIFHLSHACYMVLLRHLPCFSGTNNVRWKACSMNLPANALRNNEGKYCFIKRTGRRQSIMFTTAMSSSCNNLTLCLHELQRLISAWMCYEYRRRKWL